MPSDPNARSAAPLPSPRILCDHKVNPLNDRLTITVLDVPGAGGANHEYRVEAVDDGSGKPYQIADHHISFQNGPIAENGINGITQEVLLAIVADRLRCFQAGPYSCRENAVALTHVETAMLWLHKRTLERMQRGVEGTSAK